MLENTKLKKKWRNLNGSAHAVLYCTQPVRTGTHSTFSTSENSQEDLVKNCLLSVGWPVRLWPGLSFSLLSLLLCVCCGGGVCVCVCVSVCVCVCVCVCAHAHASLCLYVCALCRKSPWIPYANTMCVCDRFSFCQYPFILSIAAKRSILQKDSEQQMIIQARVRLRCFVHVIVVPPWWEA